MQQSIIQKEYKGPFSPDREWKDVIELISDLPPMPQVTAHAMGMIDDPNVGADQLAETILSDAALTARILKISNSAKFAQQREVTNLEQAIQIVGFNTLKAVIILANLQQPQSDAELMALQDLLWENSICTATGATLIARFLEKRYEDEIFLLGLLRGIGQSVMLSQKKLANDYLEVVDTIRHHGGDYSSVELVKFGFPHSLIGALVVEEWNFPLEIARGILRQDESFNTIETRVDEKAAIVKLSNILVHAAEIGQPEGYSVDREKADEIAIKLGYDEETVTQQLDDLTAEIKEQFGYMKHVYS